MKMYFFDPNAYSEHYTVMAETPQAALDALKRFMIDKGNYFADRWEDATLDSLPNKYTICEVADGVQQGEYC